MQFTMHKCIEYKRKKQHTSYLQHCEITHELVPFFDLIKIEKFCQIKQARPVTNKYLLVTTKTNYLL